MTERTIIADDVTCPKCLKADQFTQEYEPRKMTAMWGDAVRCKWCSAKYKIEYKQVCISTEVQNEPRS